MTSIFLYRYVYFLPECWVYRWSDLDRRLREGRSDCWSRTLQKKIDIETALSHAVEKMWRYTHRYLPRRTFRLTFVWWPRSPSWRCQTLPSRKKKGFKPLEGRIIIMNYKRLRQCPLPLTLVELDFRPLSFVHIIGLTNARDFFFLCNDSFFRVVSLRFHLL